jgi:DNA repair exonuclease SbcCD nuclease subunit
MVPLKFIHAADLHLDSPFSGLHDKNAEVARIAQTATFSAFDELVKAALREKVDFCLVAGDIYDSREKSLLAQLRFRNGLEKLSEKGISSFVVHGNHDPLDGWSASLAWPERVKIFGGEKVEEVQFFKDGKEAARIYGISYPVSEVRENLVPRFPHPEGAPFSVGLLHANLGTDTGHEPYAPCTLGDLAAKEYDYWALGHVHTRALHSLGGRAVAVYPGNLQGRHPGERGPRGAILVNVDSSGKIETDFIPVDTLRWETLEIDISPLADLDALIGTLKAGIDEYSKKSEGRHLCLRINLEGRGPLHAMLQRPGVLTDLETDLRQQWAGTEHLVWIERLEDRTRPAVDLEKRRRADDFVAGLLDEFDSLREKAHQDKDKVIDSLKELFHHSRLAGKFLDEPDEKLLDELIAGAQNICIDRLLADRED